MNLKKYFFLLGANDPEMCLIEKTINNAGLQFAFATVVGVRCHSGNAYQADPVYLPSEKELVVVECEPRNTGNFLNMTRIDHHRPGDNGFNMGPVLYWEASSIGQLYNLLGLPPTQEARIMAACDHCFPAAMRGECPGVSVSEVSSLKISEIAKGVDSSENEVREQIALFREKLILAPEVMVGGQILKDLRGHYLGEGYSITLLSAQFAITAEGYGAILRLRDRLGEPEKITISGHISPETVSAFKESWAPMQGLVRPYGVPARGYAGAYVV